MYLKDNHFDVSLSEFRSRPDFYRIPMCGAAHATDAIQLTNACKNCLELKCYKCPPSKCDKEKGKDSHNSCARICVNFSSKHGPGITAALLDFTHMSFLLESLHIQNSYEVKFSNSLHQCVPEISSTI